MKFARNLVQGMLAVELLGRLLPQKRAYETVTGSADQLYQDGIKRICSSISDGSFWSTLTQVLSSFDQLELDLSSHRPIIGLVGDDYTRGNAFANNNIVRNIEDMGGEVWTVPIWSSYLEFQMSMKPQKMWRRGRYLEFLTDTVKATLGKIDIKQIERQFAERLQCYPDPSFSEMMEFGTQYVDERNEPLTIMALSHINHLLSSGVDGLVNLVGFQCMIHSIVLANMKPVCARYGNIPVLSLFFDFQENIHQKNRLEAFMYQVSQFRDNKNNLEPGSSCRRLEHLSSIGA
jgi:predicted nucleotide-binding protein (sugar kinase/HSP70/actin superfamily)